MTTKTYQRQALTRAFLRCNTRGSLGIGPRCNEKPNYPDSAHDNGVDSIGSIHDDIKAARPLFKGPAILCCQKCLFCSIRQPRLPIILILNCLLLLIRIPVERCAVQEKWCYASRVYDIEIKSFAENDRRRPTRSQTIASSLFSLSVYSLWANDFFFLKWSTSRRNSRTHCSLSER